MVILAAVCAGTMPASATSRTASPYHKLAIFSRVLSHLERHYVAPLDEDKVVLGAIRGMMRTVDPHSAFLTPEELGLLEADTRGEFGGIGVEVSIKNDVLTIISPMPDTPAEKAGIKPGDQILAISGNPTEPMSIDEVVRAMRGEPGTDITITIGRETVKAPFDLTLTREIIHVTSAIGELLAPGFAWLRVRTFQDGTTAEVIDIIERLTRETGGLKGIMLDLRQNPGGVLNEAVRLSDLFVPKGTIVTTRGRDGTIIDAFTASGDGPFLDTPVVALIDGATASAAEIVAGALKDCSRALLVGTRTFGKGSVQSIIDLGEGYGLKLTVALYYTPNGKSIQAEGVHPDVIIASREAPKPDDETAALTAIPGEQRLPGHLAPAPSETPAIETVDIKDYQLRIGFQLLTGISRTSATPPDGD